MKWSGYKNASVLQVKRLREETNNPLEGNENPLKYSSKKTIQTQVQQEPRSSVSGSKKVLRIPRGKTLNIDTWNIKSLYEAEKLANTAEMSTLNIDMVVVSEAWWPHNEEFQLFNKSVYFARNYNKSYRNSSGIIVTNELEKCYFEYFPCSVIGHKNKCQAY